MVRYVPLKQTEDTLTVDEVTGEHKNLFKPGEVKLHK